MPVPAVAQKAPAKINLALHVTGRRADGYHMLDSVAVFADVGERVEVSAAERLTLKISGPFAAHSPADASDLAWRAAEAFFAEIGETPAVRLRVEKAIPAGAGLGGGSADAAAVLSALNAFTEARLPGETLRAIGLRLGADVPMCVAARALRARGVGEEIAPIEGWPALPMVLVWPGKTVSTAAVFGALAKRDNPALREMPEGADVKTVAAWLAECRNDLEAPALTAAPEIGEVLSALRASEDCLLARMSGSGSACFGLYVDTKASAAAAKRIAAERTDWWVKAAEAR